MMTEPVQRSFIHIFSTLVDPRVENDNKRHLLIDIIAITICSVICKCETWEEIAEFGEAREDFFKSFLELPNGIPSHDTFRRVFLLLDPKDFNLCFFEWTKFMGEKVSREVIAIDGKAIRGSAFESRGQRAIHLVSAWATDRGIVLGQLKVEEKSNEITAIPEVLNSIDIKDSIVTIDAMGCQTEIAECIVKKKGDYVLALKKNQGSFYERVEEAFKRGFETDFRNIKSSFYQSKDESHGRVEERSYFKIDDIDFLNRTKEWAGLSAIGLAESIITLNGKITIEKRYYITSLNGDAKEFGNAVRKHWQVENNLHWVLDVQFRDDASIKREKNSAANFSVIKRAALNLLKQINPEWKRKKKMIKAMCSDEYLKKLIMGSCS